MVAYLACKNDIGLLFLPFEHVGKYPRLAARLNITSVMFSMFIFGQVRFTPNVLLSHHKCIQREIATLVVDQKKKTKRNFTPEDLRGLAQMLCVQSIF